MAHPLLPEFYSGVAERIRTRSIKSCSRWATQRRIMPDGNPYSLTDYPYVKEILDSKAQKNWIMKGAQTGLSEAAFTIAFYEADRNDQPVLYFFPTQKMAETFSKTRFKEVVQYSDYLKRIVINETVEMKQLAKGRIQIAGANSQASLRGVSSGRLFFDELDIWEPTAQYMAEERASGRKDGDKRIWGFSTPRFPNCGVHKQYMESTQEHFYFDCPHCGEEIELTWPDNIEICGASVDDPEVHKSYLKCDKCQGKLSHVDKPNWLATGRWKATNPEADPNIARGFHVSQMYSPTVNPAELVIAYLRGHGDEAARREFYNSKLGLPFIEDAYQVNDAHINEAMSSKYSMGAIQLPIRGNSSLVTLGIDQGGPTHHWAAVQWEFERDSYGDPNDRAIGKLIGCGQLLQDDWQGVYALMRTYRVWRCVIDYFPEPTHARAFARQFAGAVYLCQYVRGAAASEVRMTEDEYGANICRVDKVSWLSKALGRVMCGRMKLPLDFPASFRDQLKAPVRTLEKNTDGQYVAKYVETGPDHYAHAMVYAEIALKILDPALHSNDTLESIR